MPFLFCLFLAYLLDRAQIKMCAGNYGSQFNGLGCVDNVNRRVALAPMAYRVLVPWLIWLAERIVPSLRSRRLDVLYEPLKVLLLAVALWATQAALGTMAMLALAAMLPATFTFEYWDWEVELAGLALALTGNLELSLIGGGLAALSRPETAPLVALVYGLRTGDVSGTAAVGAVVTLLALAVRLWVGRRRLYCSFWMWRRNIAELCALAKWHPWYLSNLAVTVAVTAFTLAAVVYAIAGGWAGWTWLVPLAFLGAGWLAGVAAETRIFIPCLLWVVWAASNVLA
jgi:hypothetical protein